MSAKGSQACVWLSKACASIGGAGEGEGRDHWHRLSGVVGWCGRAGRQGATSCSMQCKTQEVRQHVQVTPPHDCVAWAPVTVQSLCVSARVLPEGPRSPLPRWLGEGAGWVAPWAAAAVDPGRLAAAVQAALEQVLPSVSGPPEEEGRLVVSEEREEPNPLHGAHQQVEPIRLHH